MKVILIILSFALSGCSAYKDLKNNQEPDKSLNSAAPNKWQEDVIATKQAPDIFKNGWADTFSDSKLDKIINEIIKYNYDIEAAIARVSAAEEEAKKAGASLTPAVNANLGTVNSGSGNNSKSGSMGASIDVSWEADLWGRVRAGQRAAKGQLEVSQADLQFVKQSLAAQGAKSYFLAIESSNQQKYAQEIYDNYKKDLAITEAFLKQGLVPIQDVHLAKSELASSKNSLEEIKNATKKSLRSLELLMGKYPSGKFQVENNLPKTPAMMKAGIPSEILERRPDIIAAERKVAVSFDKVTQAKAARLPSLSLTTNLGGSSSSLSQMSDPTNIFWNVAANLVAPIIDGGSRKADVKIATAEQKQAVAQYKKAALTAFSEVENALSNEQSLRKRIKALEMAYDQTKRAEKIAQIKYEKGEGLLLDLQQIKRKTIAAKIELLRLKQELLSGRVNLYLALGSNYN